MNFSAGLPWMPVSKGGMGVPVKVEGVFSPVEIKAPKTVLVNEEKPLAVPGFGSGNNDTLKGFGDGVWQTILSLFASNSNSGSGSGGGSMLSDVKVPWEAFEGAPSNATSGADGKSGDINQTVNFGDLIARGYKFDLASLPTWAWVALGGMGLIAFLKFNKKGKK